MKIKSFLLSSFIFRDDVRRIIDEELSSATSDSNKKIKHLKQFNSSLSEALDVLNIKLNKSTVKLDKVSKECDELKDKITSITDKLFTSEGIIEIKKKTIEKLHSIIAEQDNTISTLSFDLDNERLNNKELIGKIDEINKKKSLLNREITTLKLDNKHKIKKICENIDQIQDLQECTKECWDDVVYYSDKNEKVYKFLAKHQLVEEFEDFLKRGD